MENGVAVAADEVKFSIFNPVITFKHREFYERIISELNGIFPICNQGKCTAIEISEDATEQEQITDLMKRVENFSGELLEVTKKLFDQFYQAKEDFAKSIFSTTAYIKINLMDRNLLERSCDVRWWALETAFSDCIALADKFHLALKELDEQFEGLRESAELAPLIDDWRSVYRGRVDFLVNAEAHDLFAKKAEAIASAAGKAQAGVKKQIEAALDELKGMRKKISFACDRLEDINSSYTLYRDLIIADQNGFILANSNKQTRERVLGLNVAAEGWFRHALKTKDGTEYHAQDLAQSKVEDIPSLVYSTAIRENSDNNGKVIGAMGIFFDFQGEAKMILDDYMPKDKGVIKDGWYSFFTSEQGVIIASSDEAIIEAGKHAHVPRRHRHLTKGERCTSYAVVEGVDSALFSAKTDGYLEYEGLGWTSHIIMPKEEIFRSNPATDHIGLSAEELMHSKLIPEINKQTYVKVQDDKESIQLISLNGIVFASKLGKRGVALGPIFDQITNTGDFATSKMEDLLAEMAVGELDLNLTSLENFSKQAIDVIDRNLFERAADIRWWATDQYFWTALQDPTPDNFQRACNRLKVINGSYTMYRNLVLADANGDIVACSKAELRNELKKLNVSDQHWFQQGMRTNQSNQYAVQDVCHSELEKTKNRSLVYSGGVRKSGAREGEAIGVLGVLFDWDTEAQKILRTCLPRDKNGNYIEGCAAFYTNAQGEIIETAESEKFPVGLKLNLGASAAQLGKGESASGLFQFQDTQYIIGSSRTQGYREYAGLSWIAHILRPMN